MSVSIRLCLTKILENQALKVVPTSESHYLLGMKTSEVTDEGHGLDLSFTDLTLNNCT